MIIYLSRSAIAGREPNPVVGTVMRRYPRIFIGPAALPLFCLAPHGVFLASRITPRAVSSYLAFSPLPALFSKTRLCLFCDTLRQRDFSIAAPAFSTRHAAVWCSDFPPANPAYAGFTSDHLPSTENLAHKQKSGSQETKREKDAKQDFLASWFPDSEWRPHCYEENRNHRQRDD